MKTDPTRLIPRAVKALTDAGPRLRNFKAILGFDGFVDEILAVVDKRESATQFSRVPTIAQLAERFAQAAGKSSNVELVIQRVKLGGNGPIMANALANFSLPITYIGCLGHPHLHPVFADFARTARVISIAEPGHTDALEFDDGKIMMGKHQSLRDVTWENLTHAVPCTQLTKLINDAALVSFVNWTMLPAMSDIWKRLLSDVCPSLTANPQRLLFFDLADPEKRTTEDIREAMQLISGFSAYFRVVLGLNEKESFEVAEALDLKVTDRHPESIQKLAADLRSRLGIFTVVIHPTAYAVAASASSPQAADEKSTVCVDGPYTSKPLITTGAGDHFNSGFCLGNLLGLDKELCLFLGVATSGYYVRTGKSPNISDLADFLKNWPTS